jgi:dihydrofolate reductase
MTFATARRLSGMTTRNVTMIMTASIDGYVKTPEGHGGGLPEPEELERWKLHRIRQAGTHIMGRVTYEEMSSFWPTSTGDYAAPMNDIPKVVFSKTLTEANWPTSQIANGDLAEEIAALKQQPGGEIIAWGGPSFVQALTRANLVDEYVIITQPIAYGIGDAIFRDLPKALELRPIVSHTFPTGTALNIFRPTDR